MSLEKLKNRAFENAAVRAEYDALENEFELINQLLEMRKASGLTQEQLAEKMNTKKSNISRMEKGGSTPKVDTLRKYAKACGFELEMSFRRAAEG